MPEPTRRRRLLVLAICCASIVVVVMDISIVNVALPSIRGELDASVSGLQWTVDAYTLVLASFLVLAGSTADRVGRAMPSSSGSKWTRREALASNVRSGRIQGLTQSRRTRGDAWIRQGLVVSGREPRCCQASLNRQQNEVPANKQSTLALAA